MASWHSGCAVMLGVLRCAWSLLASPRRRPHSMTKETPRARSTPLPTTPAPRGRAAGCNCSHGCIVCVLRGVCAITIERAARRHRDFIKLDSRLPIQLGRLADRVPRLPPGHNDVVRGLRMGWRMVCSVLRQRGGVICPVLCIRIHSTSADDLATCPHSTLNTHTTHRATAAGQGSSVGQRPTATGAHCLAPGRCLYLASPLAASPPAHFPSIVISTSTSTSTNYNTGAPTAVVAAAAVITAFRPALSKRFISHARPRPPESPCCVLASCCLPPRHHQLHSQETNTI